MSKERVKKEKLPKPDKGYQTTKAERLAYPSYAFGQNMIYGLVSGYLAIFLTDYLGIAATVVSVIFLVSKIWDAVNDPLFGLIVDKVNFKKSKFKPWLKLSLFLIPLMTVAMFWIPSSLPYGAKIALVCAAYFLWDTAYTMSDVPVFSMLTSMTDNVNERSAFLSFGSIASGLVALVLAIGLVPQLESDKLGFGWVSVIVAGIAFLTMLPMCFKSKERNRAVLDRPQKTSAKDLLRYVKSNKYLMIFYGSYLIQGCFALSTALFNYVAVYMMGGLNYVAIVTACAAVPVLILYVFMPKLTARFDRMNLYKFFTLISLALGLITYFVGWGNTVVYIVLAVARLAFALPLGMLAFTFTTDCVEYGHYKSGIRKEGMTFSVQTFSTKFNAAISGALGLALLGAVGYIGGVDGEFPAQTEATLQGMWNIVYLVPAGGTLLSLPLLFMYKLKVKDVQIMSNINAGKITKEEGEALMSRKY